MINPEEDIENGLRLISESGQAQLKEIIEGAIDREAQQPRPDRQAARRRQIIAAAEAREPARRAAYKGGGE